MQHDSDAGRSDPRLWRILDANANRAVEGLRVVEEFIRFVLDDRHLAEMSKRLRHDLTQQLAQLDRGARLSLRDTAGDVGTQVSVEHEYDRRDVGQVALANLKRVQEALRSLEEFCKLLGPPLAASFESLRYRSYVLEKSLGITIDSQQRLAQAHLYVLIDAQGPLSVWTDRVRRLLEAPIDVVQLRDKHLSDRELLERARILRAWSRDAGVLMVVNDRPDIATLAQADAVHVGQEELTVQDVRGVAGPGMMVGVSTHSIDQARQAVLDGANYLGVGPTFPSSTKQFQMFPGLPLLKQVYDEIRLPTFAIGGIHANNLPAVMETGMRRVAVSGAVWATDDPVAAAHALGQRLTTA